MNLSELCVGAVGYLRGKRFKVIYRAPEDRSSGITDIRFENGNEARFVWDYDNPTTVPLKKKAMLGT